MKNAKEYIKEKHNGEIPYKYGADECARLMESYAKHYFDSKAKDFNLCRGDRNCFEYRVIDHDMFDEDEIQLMNSMGSKGWEIIKILDPMKWLNSEGMFVRIYYKRVKQS